MRHVQVFLFSLQVHAAIRKDPVLTKKPRAPPAEKKTWRKQKMSYEQKKEALKQKLAQLMEVEDE